MDFGKTLVVVSLVIIFNSCAVNYLPLSYGTEETFVPVAEDTGYIQSYTLEADYRGQSVNPFLMLVGVLTPGETFKAKASGTFGHAWSNDEGVRTALSGSIKFVGGSFFETQEEYYPGFGMGGQVDWQHSFLMENGKSTIGVLYALDYEWEGPYRNFRRKQVHSGEQWVLYNDLGSNGFSSAAQVYCEWSGKAAPGKWSYFIRPFGGFNLPGEITPLVYSDDTGLVSDFNGGLYLGARKGDFSLYIKGKISIMMAANIALGFTF